MELKHTTAPSEQTARAVSAAMDEPTAAAELGLTQDSSGQDTQTTAETWQRYHLIGQALRDELPKDLNMDLSASIAQAIKQEPALGSQYQAQPATGRTVSGRVEQVTSKLLRWLGQPLGQLAVASSVAVVAILGVQSMGNDADNDSGALQVMPTVPLAPAKPVSLELDQSALSEQPETASGEPDELLETLPVPQEQTAAPKLVH